MHTQSKALMDCSNWWDSLVLPFYDEHMEHFLIGAEVSRQAAESIPLTLQSLFYPSVFLWRMWGQTDSGCSSFEQCEGGGKCVCALIVNARRGGTLAAWRHPAGGVNVSLSQHHSSASCSYLYLEATKCPCEPSAKDHVLVAQTHIIVGTKIICSNIVSLSNCSPH